MTTVVVYNEFKPVSVKLSGGDFDSRDEEVLTGVTRKFELVDGQSVTITAAEPKPAGDPTVAEYVARLRRRNYRYNVSSQEEIDAAIAARGPRTNPTDLKAEQVPGSFTPVPQTIPWADPATGNTAAPLASSTEPLPGIAKLNEAENNIPAPEPQPEQ